MSLIASTGPVYVTDGKNHRVELFDPDGKFSMEFKTGPVEMEAPIGITLDSRDNIYITDFSKHCVYEFKANGELVRQWGSQGTGRGQFDKLDGIAVDAEGDIYVADLGNTTVQKFLPR